MPKRSQTFTLDQRRHGYDPAAHVRDTLQGDTFKNTTWSMLEFKGSNKFTLIATGSKGEELTIQFYAEPSLEKMAHTAADVGGEFGRSPSSITLFEELRNPNGERKFSVTH